MAFNSLLSTITKNIKSNSSDDLEIDNLIESSQDIKLLKYLTDVYLLLSNQYNIMANLDNEKIVYECYERLLIIITEKSLISYQNGTNLIQDLNSIIIDTVDQNIRVTVITEAPEAFADRVKNGHLVKLCIRFFLIVLKKVQVNL